MFIKYVLVKPTLIDLELQKWTTRGKLTQPERLNEMATVKSGCDSLNSANNLIMKAEREIRRVFSTLAWGRNMGLKKRYIAQTSADSFEVRIRQFFNLFNSQAAACGVLEDYVSP